MGNHHLFALINAGPALHGVRLVVGVLLAQWLIYLVPLLMAVAWWRGDELARRDLLQMLLATLIALGIGQIVSHLWPQPRPAALGLGSQYLEHDSDASLPSDHVTVLWSLALAAFGTRRFDVWGLPLLAVGGLVGWSRIYLGVHFPFDIVAALPVAAAGALTARALQRPMRPVVGWLLALHARVCQAGISGWRVVRKRPGSK